jgi:bifunctional non-homologous end joining protein LigD
MPDWISPMLATLTERRFSDPDWIFERKLDGVRGLAYKRLADLQLYTRNRNSLAGAYPEIVDALRRQPAKQLIIDGEIVAFQGERSTFNMLQARRELGSSIDVCYYVFDILYLDGTSLLDVPQLERKELLRATLEFGGPLRYTEHRQGDGEAFYREACRDGWEGLIAKRAAAPYAQKRSTDWLKFKCVAEQELVIGGFTDPQRSRVGFGALLVGYYQAGRLRYAGKVGTGYDTRLLLDLRKQLDALEVDRPPFADPVRERGAHWVRPRLVAEIGFTEWTGDGKLRHPRFLGLRSDKDPRQVVRETPR